MIKRLGIAAGVAAAIAADVLLCIFVHNRWGRADGLPASLAGLILLSPMIWLAIINVCGGVFLGIRAVARWIITGDADKSISDLRRARARNRFVPADPRLAPEEDTDIRAAQMELDREFPGLVKS